ncbi:MAG: glycosyl hydrolase family 18 protein [Clostridium sp.]
MKKLLKVIIPTILCISLLVPSAVSANAVSKHEETKAASQNNKRIVTYFPSWGTYQAGQQNITVSDIAWDKVTHINHGFFEITNDYKIQTTDSYADYENTGFGHGPKEDWDKYPSTGVPPGTVYGHFGEYKYYKEKYPDVKLLISVGGWTRSDKFHEVAKSAANRKTLAMSMVDFMKKYPFVDGMDIDWEYPGITRAPEDQYDRGCVGGPEDKENFTLLLKDIRETFDANGMKDKLLTVAVSAGEAKIRNTEPDKYAQYVDYIGVMTYDYAGGWDNVTGHLAGMYQNPKDTTRPKFNMDDSMKIFRDDYNVPADKLLAGTPLYTRGWSGVEPGPNGDGLFQSGSGKFDGNLGDGGQYSWYDVAALEKTGEWQKFRDPIARTPYLYNKSKKQFITYEDEESLIERVSYVNKNNYGGLIVWDASGDNVKAGHTMHTIMYEGFKNNTIIIPPFEPEDFDQNRVVDILDLAMLSTKYNKASGQQGFDVKFDLNKDNIIDLFDLVQVAKKMPESNSGDDGGDQEVLPDTYDPTKGYEMNNEVVYGGKTYICQRWWVVGVTPGTDETVWKLK